jgi:N-acetylmuramoyl-L-alanine amidase
MAAPYPIGSRIRHLRQTFGTAGCLAYFEAFPHRILVLTASHVLAPDGAGGNDPVFLNDASAAEGDPGDVGGRLYCWTGVDPAGTPADAALAWIDPDVVSPDIPEIGRPTGVNESPRAGDALQFYGATSKHQTTQIIPGGVGRDVTVIAGPADQPVSYNYTRQLLCTKASNPGDSGAVVLDMQRRVVGLLAGLTTLPDGDVTVVTPISAVRRHRQWNGQVLNIIATIPAGAEAPPPAALTPVVPVEDLDGAVDTLARTVWGEDRGGGTPDVDPAAGMKAVACLIVNRVRQQRSGWGTTIEAVCKAPKQFGVWNPALPGFAATAADQADYAAMIGANEQTALFPVALQVARDAISGGQRTPLDGSGSWRARRCPRSRHARGLPALQPATPPATGNPPAASPMPFPAIATPILGGLGGRGGWSRRCPPVFVISMTIMEIVCEHRKYESRALWWELPPRPPRPPRNRRRSRVRTAGHSIAIHTVIAPRTPSTEAGSHHADRTMLRHDPRRTAWHSSRHSPRCFVRAAKAQRVAASRGGLVIICCCA